MLLKKLNNKGYMLVEIIIASVLAFSVVYYLLNLTYDFKDKNEDVYFSTATLSDKINITKNIMNDLEGKSVDVVHLSESNADPSYITLKVGESTDYKQIFINKNDKTIKYGKLLYDDVGTFDVNDQTYYEKKIDDFLEFGSIEIKQNKESKYITLTIPITNIYNDTEYDIKLLIKADLNIVPISPIYTITLNNQGATQAGTTSIYEKHTVGIYKDNIATNQMKTNSNPITVPQKTGYTFGGYYTGKNGTGTQLINASGYITSSFTNNRFSSNATLYAKWTRSFTCANAGGTTTYMGKKWYTVKNTSDYCELVLNSTVGSSSGNTYNASTGEGSGSVYSYIKNYSNGTNTIAQECDAGLISLINADISRLGFNMPKISNPNNLYWVTNQMIYSHNPVYDYRVSFRNYYVSGGSDDRLITKYNSSQMQIYKAPVLVSSRIDNEGLINVRNYSPNIKKYDVKTYRERHTYDYGSIYYSNIYIRFQNNKYNKYFEVQYNNSSSNKLSSLNQFQQVNFYNCGSYGLPKHAEKIFAFKYSDSSFKYSWNNSGWKSVSKFSSSSINSIELQFAATLSEDDFADGNFHFENSNDCKELVDYEIYGEPKPIYYRPHIIVIK